MPRKPFPQTAAYQGAYVLPDRAEAARNDALQNLYRQWKRGYFRLNPHDDSQAYIHWGGEEGITVSEAHGYGMMLLCYFAGFDPDAQADFDRLVRFYLAHPSEICPPLMAWQQADEEGRITDINGVDSATDGDLDIAYALLLADAQWGSDGDINYLQLARDSMAASMKGVVEQEHGLLLIGDWAKNSGDPGHRRLTRPSDFMFQHFKSFQSASGDGDWARLADSLYDKSTELFQRYAPNTGLLPNFALLTEEGMQPQEDSYSWDACRVPWRLATDAIVTGETRLLNQLGTINTWLRESTGGKPNGIVCGYRLDGTKTVSYLDPAFAAPFMVCAMLDAGHPEWLTALWDWNIRQVTLAGGYYDNTIRLLCLLVANGSWWVPEG